MPASLAGHGDWLATTLEETGTLSDDAEVAVRHSVDWELRDRGILRGDAPLSGAYAGGTPRTE